MAKNMNNTAYRKLNVDAFDPDNYDENEDVAETPGLGPDEKTVISLLNTNQLREALTAALQSPPLKTKNQAVKDKATNLVAKVLTSFKASDIKSTLQDLSIDEGDILMKYIFKAMEITSDSTVCHSMLTWHSQVHSRFGSGCIIRVLSDRHRL